MNNPTKTVYAIYCSTGCSCCSYENHCFGFFDNWDDTKKLVDEWRIGKGNPLGSQYHKYGLYNIKEYEAEILPDGRFIINNIVYSKDEVDRFPWRIAENVSVL